MQSLVEHGRVIRGYLGVWMQDIDPKLAKQFGLEEATGVVVSEVVAKSPAEKAGIKVGDVITEFDGKSVKDSRHLKLQVGQTSPNERVSLKLLRDGKSKTVELTLKELEDNEQTAKVQKRDQDSGEALAGVTVGDIDRAARNQFRLPADLRGAVVTDVDEDTPAYEAGLRPGDVILEINRKPVRSAEDAVTLTEKMPEKTILLRIWSRGGSRYMVVDESKVR
jgi:serine protease Do